MCAISATAEIAREFCFATGKAEPRRGKTAKPRSDKTQSRENWEECGFGRNAKPGTGKAAKLRKM